MEERTPYWAGFWPCRTPSICEVPALSQMPWKATYFQIWMKFLEKWIRLTPQTSAEYLHEVLWLQNRWETDSEGHMYDNHDRSLGCVREPCPVYDCWRNWIESPGSSRMMRRSLPREDPEARKCNLCQSESAECTCPKSSQHYLDDHMTQQGARPGTSIVCAPCSTSCATIGSRHLPVPPIPKSSKQMHAWRMYLSGYFGPTWPEFEYFSGQVHYWPDEKDLCSYIRWTLRATSHTSVPASPPSDSQSMRDWVTHLRPLLESAPLIRMTACNCIKPGGSLSRREWTCGFCLSTTVGQCTQCDEVYCHDCCGSRREDLCGVCESIVSSSSSRAWEQAREQTTWGTSS